MNCATRLLVMITVSVGMWLGLMAVATAVTERALVVFR